MGIDHKEPAYTDEAAPFIEESGGKLGGLEYLRNTIPSLSKLILPIQKVSPGDEWHGVTVQAGNDGRYIVRASHPHDFQGLVDVIDTEVVDNSKMLGKTIERIREKAQSTKVMSYGQYENPAYDGKVVVGVQPYRATKKRGSIVEHPNRPGEFVISLVDPRATWNRSGQEIQTAIYTEGDSDEAEKIKWLGGEDIEKKKSQKLIEIYKLIRASELVQDQYSFQMEFLDDCDDPIVAQVRAFARKQIADFELQGRERLVFGITPPEGIELPVVQSPDGFDSNGNPLNPAGEWAFLKTQHDNPLTLDFQPKDMKGFLISQSFSSGITPSLEHHHFRYAQKADVTVFEEQLRRKHDFTRILFGEADPEMLKFQLTKLEMVGRYSGRYPYEVEREYLRNSAGNTLLKARIVSDGRTATVEPIIDFEPGEIETTGLDE